MQGLRIRVPLDHYIWHRDLHIATVAGDPPAHPRHDSEPNLRSEAVCGFGKKSNIWRAAASEVGGGKVIEPENASDATGAVVDGEFEELARFEIAGGDDANSFGAGKKGAFPRKRNVVWGRMRGGLCEREEVESQ